MTRTEKLLYTLVVLVVSFILFLFFQNFEKINSDINKFITSMKEPKINIPNDKTIYNRKYSYKTVHETNNFIPKNIDDIKTRQFGNKAYVDVEISVDENLLLKDAHKVAEEIHNSVENEINIVKHCMVHVNPYEVK